MDIEYEATFTKVDKDEVRERLKKAGAKLIRPEFLQKRVPFTLPAGQKIKGAFLRVRDEGDRVTLSLKIMGEINKIEDQKEICLIVNDFETARSFLKELGCKEKSYQETKREIWQLDGVEICLDEWPFLEPLVEIEGKSEEEVRKVTTKLGFDWEQAFFGNAGTLIAQKYGLTELEVNKIGRASCRERV